MPAKRQYKIDIDPRILELLGPSLYTNIYYVLAELVANAYDANAKNVYIILQEDKIIVEDDGTGMSYQDGDINKYLKVAVETRTNRADSFTADGKRRKIGRKGIGKLAALSVSENVLVMTVKDGEKSGFILSRHVGANHELEPLQEDKIVFERIVNNGTSIVMQKPEYGLHKTFSAIKRNLLKIFPIVSKDFRIHIVTNDKEEVIDSFDETIIKDLGALILLGDEFRNFSEYFDSQLPNKTEVEKRLIKLNDAKVTILKLANKQGEVKEFKLEIKGWIGAYRTTRDRKKDPGDFPDNFISLLSNGKLGEYNILSVVGKNKLQEVYIVGQLHIDLFEETELPDIALSNRQGYKSDDLRYKYVLEFVRDELLPDIVNLREAYSDHKKKENEKEKIERQKTFEEELRNQVEKYKTTASKLATDKIFEIIHSGNTGGIQEIIANEMNASMNLLGLKSKVDAQKRKILICHTTSDKSMADVVYNLLSFNNVSDDEIIYTSCDNEGARIPEVPNLFEYLRDFFVNSYSTEKIIVLYVTSDEMAGSWFAVTEVGAGWITKKDHKIFNLNNHIPKLPLNISAPFQSSLRDGDKIKMTRVEFNNFVVKIQDVCKMLGVSHNSKAANDIELKRYVTLI